MHLLFADAVADQTIADLESRGHRCSVEPALTTAELPGRIAGVDGLVVRSTKVDRAVFEAADQLALVIRAGAGTNTIDVEAAARNGVLVCNVPGRLRPASSTRIDRRCSRRAPAPVSRHLPRSAEDDAARMEAGERPVIRFKVPEDVDVDVQRSRPRRRHLQQRGDRRSR